MPYNYTDAEITKRSRSGGKDPGRASGADKLAARAAAGDQAALQELIGLSQSNGGWATNDAVNYGRMKLRQLGYDMSGLDEGGGYIEARDGSFNLGKTLGSVARIAAPLAGAFIPGVGMLGAGLIGGLGNAGGQLLSRGKISPLEAMLAGGAGAAGNKLLGNGLGSVPGSAPGGVPGIPGGNTTAGGTSGPVPGQGGGGPLDFLDRYGKIGQIAQKYGPLAVGIAGGINQAGSQNQADDYRQQATGIALQDWQSRAPARAAAMTRAMAPLPARVDLSQQLADPTDPYRPRRAA